MSLFSAIAKLLGLGGEPAQPVAKTAYKGGELNRIWKTWQPTHRSGDAAIYEDQSLLSARMRDLFRNDPLMKKLKRELCKHVIGAHGVQTFADVLMPDGPPGERDTDDAFNFESDDLFTRWSEDEADAEGKFSWPQLQWQHFSEALARGGSLLLEVADDDPKRSVPLAYQLLEYEQLDVSLDRPATDRTNRIVNGIEFDRRNRPVAYYIYDVHPYDNFQGSGFDSTRVPAKRVIHTYFPDRPSENIGVTLFTANVQSARDLDWYLGNELTAAALGALLTLIVKREYGVGSGLGFSGADPSDTTDLYGNSQVRLGPGIVADIGTNESVEVAESKRPNRDAGPFIDLIMRQAGQAAGLSRGRVTGDYAQTSYSSARAEHLDDQAYFQVLQNWCARAFVVPVRRRHTEMCAAFGRYTSISARQFANRQWEMMRLRVKGIGREQLDPEKETQAAMERIRAGLSDWEHECALRGLDWRRVALNQKRQKAFFEKHGLEFDLSASGKPKEVPAEGAANERT